VGALRHMLDLEFQLSSQDSTILAFHTLYTHEKE